MYGRNFFSNSMFGHSTLALLLLVLNTLLSRSFFVLDIYWNTNLGRIKDGKLPHRYLETHFTLYLSLYIDALVIENPLVKKYLCVEISLWILNLKKQSIQGNNKN